VSIDASAVRLEGTSENGRYVHTFPDGSEAEMTYVSHSPGVVTITHTYTPPRHRGQGVAAVLVRRAVQDFRKAGMQVIPVCWYAREQFEAHPEWKELLESDKMRSK
jgi:predicted GNAT family acetyltransferase